MRSASGSPSAMRCINRTSSEVSRPAGRSKAIASFGVPKRIRNSFLLNELQRARIDAIPQPRLVPRPVIKHVSQMSATARTHQLVAHSVSIFADDDVVGRILVPEA